jgi:hypothetical protein
LPVEDSGERCTLCYGKLLFALIFVRDDHQNLFKHKMSHQTGNYRCGGFSFWPCIPGCFKPNIVKERTEASSENNNQAIINQQWFFVDIENKTAVWLTRK